MGLSVLELYECVSQELSLEICAGKKGLEKNFERIGVMETIDFVDGVKPEGLFVISTLSFAYGRPEGIDAVKRLIMKAPSGIAIKTKRYFSSIPDELVQCAETYNIPLLEITTDISFSNFITVVSKKLQEGALGQDIHIIQQANSLRNYMNEEPLEKILENLEEMLGIECFFIDVYGNITISNSAPAIGTTNYYALGNRLLERSLCYRRRKEYIVEDLTIAFYCYAGETFLGLLILADIGQLSEECGELVKLSLSYIAVRACEMRISQMSRIDTDWNILSQILFLGNSGNTLSRSRIKDLGYDLRERYVFIVLNVREENTHPSVMAVVEYCKAQLLRRFEDITISADRTGLKCLLSFDEQSNLNQRNSVYNRMTAFRNSALASQGDLIDIGISLIQNDPENIVQSSIQAQNAITLGRLYRPDKYVYSYNAFVIQGMLCQCSQMQECQWIEEYVIKPISERDELYESCLWETLDILFKNRSLKEASTELYIHVSTLRYRLKKIEEITGFDYFSSYGNYVLHTAYLIWMDKKV